MSGRACDKSGFATPGAARIETSRRPPAWARSVGTNEVLGAGPRGSTDGHGWQGHGTMPVGYHPGVGRPSGLPRRREGTMEIIGVLIAGIIIGLLGKFVAPGDKDNIPIWLTIVCGIAGVLIGYYAAAALGVEETDGVDWLRWIISIAVAAVLVMLAASVTGRRSTSRRDVV